MKITGVETHSRSRTYYFVDNDGSYEGTFTVANKDERRRPILLTLGSPGHAMPVRSFEHTEIVKRVQADIEEFFNKTSGEPKERTLRW